VSATYGMYGTSTASPTTAAATAAADPQRRQGEVDKQEFLKLLVLQLSMQDPLKPLTDHAYIAQLAQFSSLEQMGRMNEEVSALRLSMEDGQLRQTALGALSLLGTTATVRGSDSRSLTATVEAVRLLGQTVLLRMAGEEYSLDQLEEVSGQ
jgi:flagellar basal-body rod modification protein FlgD